MKRLVMVAAALIAVGGCVANTMRGYIGQDVRQVQLAYGPPANVVNLGNGTRAYQWARISSSTTPVSAVTTTTKEKKGGRTSTTELVGGETTVTRCLYTLFTAWSPERNG